MTDQKQADFLIDKLCNIARVDHAFKTEMMEAGAPPMREAEPGGKRELALSYSGWVSGRYGPLFYRAMLAQIESEGKENAGDSNSSGAEYKT